VIEAMNYDGKTFCAKSKTITGKPPAPAFIGPIDARRLWYPADGTNRTYGTDGTYEGIGTPEDGYVPALFAHPS